jgi:GT2 family glycosyltransferase
MDIYAYICTRSIEEMTETTDKLVAYLAECSIKSFLLPNTNSIFQAYNHAYTVTNPSSDDIVIMCHDDIVIREKPKTFLKKLKETLDNPDTGFVGPAGTEELGPDAVWWNQERWALKKHHGKVYHLDPAGREYETPYGPPGEVVVLDGLFLAAKGNVIEAVGLTKPAYFSGEWDFYDLHYTSKAHLSGYKNRILDINILHNSRGELVGRDSWHNNRQAFIENTNLPLKVKND